MPKRFLETAILLALLAVLPTQADPGACLVDAARKQIGVTVEYDSGYRRMPYPNGDVSPERGVCTDVVVRAYRQLGIDLQVHFLYLVPASRPPGSAHPPHGRCSDPDPPGTG